MVKVSNSAMLRMLIKSMYTAMRIHVSNTYAQLLLNIGGFNLERRCWTSKSLVCFSSIIP